MMFFRQLEVGYHAVFAYLIGDTDTGDAMVVTPRTMRTVS